MAGIESAPPQEFLEPEQPPVEPAIEALKFIQELNPKNPEEIRGFFEEYKLTRVMTAIIETFGETRPRFDENRPSLGEKRPRPAGNTVFSGRGLDRQFNAGILPERLYDDGTSRPACVHAWVESYDQDKATDEHTIKALFIYEDGTLVGRETLNGLYGRTIKAEDLDQPGSFANLQYLCGAMIEHLLILKAEQEKAEPEALAA